MKSVKYSSKRIKISYSIRIKIIINLINKYNNKVILQLINRLIDYINIFYTRYDIVIHT